MTKISNQQSVPVADRLMAWVDDVQLSNRVGFPHYANPGELKADIRSLVEQLETLKEGSELWQMIESRNKLIIGLEEQLESTSISTEALLVAERDGLREQLEALQVEVDGMARAPYGQYQKMRERAEQAEEQLQAAQHELYDWRQLLEGLPSTEAQLERALLSEKQRQHELQEQLEALRLVVARQLTPLDVAATHIDILRRKSEDYTPRERDNVAIIVEQHVKEAIAALFTSLSNPASEHP